MELTEEQIIEKCAKLCRHYLRITFLLHEYEWTCISWGYKVMKRKHELSKIQRKRINFINRLRCAEIETFCICKEVDKIYEGNDYDKLYEALSTLKNKKLKNKDILIEKYKHMNLYSEFE